MSRRNAIPLLLLVLTLPSVACTGALNAADRIMTERNNEESGFGPARKARSDPQTTQQDWKPESPKSGLDRKRVAGKSKPSSLIADDGTLCPASADTFERVVPGDRVWCRWLDPRSVPEKQE